MDKNPHIYFATQATAADIFTQKNLAQPSCRFRCEPTWRAESWCSRPQLRAAFGPLRFPAYNYLMDILLAEDFSGITLIYTFMVVELTGQYLEPVAHAIAEKHCGRVTEFSPRFHDRLEAGDPCITKIAILADGIQKTDNDGKKP